ncbi:MAG: peptidylprolyl isomerase [Chitinophagaceae bacterium]|nr:peptidylprolyl isomerase [Chitinophagaceae bacterium]
MSIIQTIRDKGAKISVALIALALVGFILTDYFSGKGKNVFSGGSSVVGSVNGKKISYDAFKAQVDDNISRTENMYRQQGMQPPPASRLTKDAVDQAWNQEVSRLLLRGEFDRIGMRIGKKERGDMLYGSNAPDFIKKAGTDENTGIYDPIRAKQQVDQMLKNRQTPQEQKDEFNNYLNSMDDYRMQEKYTSLFSNSLNYPRWFIEKQVNDNAQVAKISMVKMLYTDSSFVDSTIQITDKEIAEYIGKRKDLFKQETSRSIHFVSFSALPTKEDSAEAKKALLDLKPEFDTATEFSSFAARDVEMQSPDIFSTPAQLPPVGKDSIVRLGKNGVYGPYLEGGAYVMAKLFDTKILPDSVKCRHVLVGTDPQSGGVDDSTASRRIDSIKRAIDGGATWEAMAMRYNSDDTKNTKGEMTFSAAQIQSVNFAKEFGQFILWDGKPGDKKVVKTSFGYHYIEILSFIKPGTQYKVAYLAKGVLASEQTDKDAQQLANDFFGQAKDMKTFDAAVEKLLKPSGGAKAIASNIRPLDAMVNATGATPMTSRSFVTNIYKAKLGEVMAPEKVESNYVVAIVTEVNEEGTMPVAKARPGVEFEIRKKKKAAIIRQKIGTVTTLEDAAAKLGKQIETIDSLRMEAGSSSIVGYEPRVIGAAFNPANKGKVVTEILEGSSGVYVIRVENTGATPSTEGSVEDQRKAKYQSGRGQQVGPMEGLRKAATIKDKRANRF